MISYALIRRVSEDLENLRTSGALLFDTRDAGNYGPYHIQQTWEMLERNEPTGVAAALLLAEMVDATLRLSKVALPRVLLEDGFIAKLQQLLALRNDIEAVAAAPRVELTSRLTEGLNALSSDFGEISPRELAIVLRDAVYSMAPPAGLTMRWLSFNAGAPSATQIPLARAVEQHESLPVFLDALRTDRPYGAYLAVIGTQLQTVVALKQPCGIAYLSSLAIDIHTGRLKEERAHNSHMAEKLDLDTMMERYPEWHTLRKDTRSSLPVTNQGLPPLSLSDLPRDKVLWFALVVEMARQKMAKQAADGVPVLAESMVRALAAPRNTLPALRANWGLPSENLADVLTSLNLPSWVLSHCAPALEGLTVETFLPQGEIQVGMNAQTKEIVPWLESSECWGLPHGHQGFRATHIRMCPVSAGLVGTQEELAAARRAILRKNLIAFIEFIVNIKTAQFWLEEGYAWFKAHLEPRVAIALQDPSVTFKPSHDNWYPLHFYKQSPKHRTMRARCWFNAKLEPDTWAHISPGSAEDLVRLLGLSGEEELPTFLQGWSRLPDCRIEGATVRWAWNELEEGHVYALSEMLRVPSSVSHRGFMEAKVSLNSASISALNLG